MRSTSSVKVHIAIDDLSGLPIMLTVTKAGYGENRKVRWFVKMFLKISIRIEKFLADGGYDAYGTRKHCRGPRYSRNTRSFILRAWR